MSSFQKTIKYIAIAFAVFLAVTIISGIANVIFSVVTSISGGIHYTKETMIDYTESFTGVNSLDINNITGKLSIKTGDSFTIKAENVPENFAAKLENDGTLTINSSKQEYGFLWFNFNGYHNPNTRITIYLPADFIAKEAKISTGAGALVIEGLQADYLLISTGAGSINGSDITAQEVKIEGGVGSIQLNDVNFTDADFNCGVGSLDVEGVLMGENRIDCGVGKVELNLTGNVENYNLNIDSGVGNIRLNGKKIKNEYRTNSDAANSIRVDGGVGDVSINFNNKE